MAVHTPPILVVIACKVVMSASQDPNADTVVCETDSEI
jgi:hypothetical protein